MATAKANDEDNDMECSVCSELFTKPKLLPCAHVLCRHCLLSWLTSNPDAQCPLCRCPIADKKDKSEEWKKVVDALPTDVAMEALVQSTRTLKEDHVCGGCRQTAAVSICFHCSDMLCSSCTAAHGNLKATRHHKVEDLATMTADKLSISQPSFCITHSDRPSELYCPTHGAAICHLCASCEHRACPEVTLFEKRAEELRAELSTMTDNLKSAEENLQQAILVLDQQLLEVDEQTKKSLAEIEKMCDRLENFVRSCRRRLKELVQKFKKEKADSIIKTKTTMSDRRGRIISNRRVADRMKSAAPCSKIEEATTTVRARVKNLDLTVAEDLHKTQFMKTLTIDSKVLTKLEHALSQLGEQRLAVLQADTWQFRPCKNVLLTNDGRTAERLKGNGAIVISTTPMQVNKLYEVRIDEIKAKACDYFPCGAVTSSPEHLTLPDTTLDGWGHALVFCDTVFRYNSQKCHIKIGNKLQSLQEGTRVGFVLEPGGFLHLFIDGKEQGVCLSQAPQSCYVFFELVRIYKKVTALPLTTIHKALKQ